MASVLGSAVLNLTTDATKLTRGLQQAERQTDQSLTKMQRLGDFAAKAAPYAAIGAAAVGAGIGLKALVDDVANVERELRPFLERSNLTVESLQQWQEIGRQLGAEDPLEGITDSIQEFKLRLGELQTEGTGPLVEALPALGLALQDLQGKTPEEQFRTLLTALQAVDDETRRLYLADELFGGAMENIIGILQAQAKEFQAVETAVRNTHNVLSGAELQKLNDYNDAVDEIGNSWNRFKQDFVVAIAPALNLSLGHINNKIEGFQREMGVTVDFLSEWGDKALQTFQTVGPGIRVALEPIPGIIGDVMSDEEADIAGYFGGQAEAVGISMAEIAEVAKTGAQGIASDFALEMSAMGSAAHDALLGGGAEGEGNLMPTGSVMMAFQQLPPLVSKIIDQGFGEHITPSWTSGLSQIGSATWDAFYGGAEGEGSFAILPTFKQAFSTDIPDYISNAVPVITDETDYLMEDGIEKPVEDGMEEAAKLVEDGMSEFEEKVGAAQSVMKTKMDVYGDMAIEAPINNAMLEAARIVGEKLRAMEAAAAATAAAMSASLVSGGASRGIQAQQDFDRSQWERVSGSGNPWDRYGGDDYYRNTATGEEISTRLYQARALRAAKAKQHETILKGGLYSHAYPEGQPMPTLPGLPSMDSGGIVSGPTLAALAMNSRPEAVIPLDRMGGMGTTIVFEGPVYGMDDFRDKVQEATLLGNRQGRQEVLYGAR